MRVLAGRMGCPQDLWSHLDPEVERQRLVDYCHAVLDELERAKLPYEDYIAIVNKRNGEGQENVVAFRQR